MSSRRPLRPLICLGLCLGAAGSLQTVEVAQAGDRAGGARRIVRPPSGTSRLQVQSGHVAEVPVLAFSPGHRLLASGGLDQCVKLWHTASGRELHSLAPRLGFLSALAFSPDGKRLAAGSLDGHAGVWETGSGRLIRRLTLAPEPVTALAFDPAGNRLLTVARDAREWRLTDGTLARILVPGSEDSRRPRLAQAGSRRLVLVRGRRISVWDRRSGAPERTLELEKEVCSLALSPDEETLALAFGLEPAALWDLRSGRPPRALSGAPASLVRYSPDGRTLAIDGANGGVLLCDPRTGQTRARLPGAGGGLSTLAFSPDGQRVAGSREAGVLDLWHVPSRRRLRTLRGLTERVRAFAVDPEGTWLATAAATPEGTSRVRLWSLRTGRPVRTWSTQQNPFTAVALHPRGTGLAVGRDDGSVALWDPATGKTLATLVKRNDGFITTDSRSVGSLAYSPEGDRLAVSDGDGDTTVWDLRTRRPLHLLPAPALLSEFGSRPDELITAGGGALRLWDLATGQERRALGGRTGPVLAAAVHLPTRTAATAGEKGEITLWSLDTGNLLHTLHGVSPAHALAFSPDGATLVSRESGGTLRLWDRKRGVVMSHLEYPPLDLTGLRFHPRQPRLFAVRGTDGLGVLSTQGRALAEQGLMTAFSDQTWAVLSTARPYDTANRRPVNGLYTVAGEPPAPQPLLPAGAHRPALLRRLLEGRDSRP